MLQEFLFALCGYTGDIFIENDDCKIIITPNLPYISPSEESLINEICILGSYYKKIDNFTKLCSSSLIDYKHSGLYKLTFSHAIKNAMHDYRKLICEIEKELLMDTTLSISHIRWRLHDYFILFPALYKVIDLVNQNEYPGCRLIDAVYKGGIPVGNETVKKVWNAIIKQCNDILIHQISVWILKGELYDPYSEFFIKPILCEKSSFGIENNQSDFLDGISRLQLAKEIEATNKRIAKEFLINDNNIPCSLPITLIDKILFIGESVHLFDGNRHKITKAIKNLVYKEIRENSFEQLREELCNKFGGEMKELRCLPEFNLLKLQSIVEQVEKYMLYRMWSLIIDQHKFLDDFFSRCIKDLFLLGRGELFAEFIQESESLNVIGRKWTKSSEAILTQALMRAARSVGMETDTNDNEDNANNFGNQTFSVGTVKVIMRHSKTTSKTASTLPIETVDWKQISLTTKVPWPIQLVIGDDAINEYGELFSFILLIRRTHGRLAHSARHISRRYVVMLRHMEFFVSCLQYHTSVDIIEAQVAKFREEALNNQDIEYLKEAHNRFLKGLRHEILYAGGNPGREGLITLCDLCLEYCSLLEMLNNSTLNDNNKELKYQLERCGNQYIKQTTVLYNILCNVEGHHKSAAYLRRLLIRLDFNYVFSTEGAELGTLMHTYGDRSGAQIHKV